MLNDPGAFVINGWIPAGNGGNLTLPVKDTALQETGQPGHSRVQAAEVVGVRLLEGSGFYAHPTPTRGVINLVAYQCETLLSGDR